MDVFAERAENLINYCETNHHVLVDDEELEKSMDNPRKKSETCALQKDRNKELPPNNWCGKCGSPYHTTADCKGYAIGRSVEGQIDTGSCVSLMRSSIVPKLDILSNICDIITIIGQKFNSLGNHILTVNVHGNSVKQEFVMKEEMKFELVLWAEASSFKPTQLSIKEGLLKRRETRTCEFDQGGLEDEIGKHIRDIQNRNRLHLLFDSHNQHGPPQTYQSMEFAPYSNEEQRWY
ncbi:hypothetical protein RF11_05594 [Thelohanellus kitauei]|uniref:Uncharacterized protein n=1 Tax=Thelohanellus kitauei TaxID=669202 RepID=A0A0C2M0H7_THEKT|nr:hypothetical protein RF11_05594 [Thelohanellus kitauei]